MVEWKCPHEWSDWSEWLAAGLHGRCRWRLPLLMTGILFAPGRRTVASWLRAAGVGLEQAQGGDLRSKPFTLGRSDAKAIARGSS